MSGDRPAIRSDDRGISDYAPMEKVAVQLAC
jgi:hypothetical protein